MVPIYDLVCRLPPRIDAGVWKSKKMRKLRGIKERNWSPTKIAHYIYHTDIKSNFTQLRPKATVNTTWTILPASVALFYLQIHHFAPEKRTAYFLLLLDNLYGIVNDFGLRGGGQRGQGGLGPQFSEKRKQLSIQ